MKKLFTLLIFIFIKSLIFSQTITNTYDELGRLTQVAYPDSSIINYTYDPSGNRTSTVIQNICFTRPNPTITTSGSLILCMGDSVTLTSASSTNYLWSTGATTQSIVIKQPGKYAVTAILTSTCSKKSDTVTVIVNPSPTAHITKIGKPNLCIGDFVILKADTSSIYKYLWSTGDTTTSIKTNTSNTYILSVSLQNGCIRTDTAKLFFSPFPIAYAGITQTICSGDGIVLGTSPEANVSYKWQPSTGLDNDMVSNPTAKPFDSITYKITATNNYGCASFDSVSINVKPSPVAHITKVSKQSICNGDTVILRADTATNYSYYWNTSETTPTIFVNYTNYYYLSVSLPNGCSKDTTVHIIFNPLPVLYSMNDVSLCYGQIKQIGNNSYSNYYSYNWQPTIGLDKSDTSQPYANPKITTTYKLKVKDTTGCFDTASITISVITLPVINAGGKLALTLGSSITLGGSPTANGNGPFNYLWSPNATGLDPYSANPTILPTSTAEYTVNVSDNNGCSNSDSVLIVVIPKDKKFIIYPNPTNGIINIVGAGIQNGIWKFSLTSTSGKIIFTDKQVHAINNSLFYQMQLDNLASATYILQVQNENYNESIRVIKTN